MDRGKEPEEKEKERKEEPEANHLDSSGEEERADPLGRGLRLLSHQYHDPSHSFLLQLQKLNNVVLLGPRGSKPHRQSVLTSSSSFPSSSSYFFPSSVSASASTSAAAGGPNVPTGESISRSLKFLLFLFSSFSPLLHSTSCSFLPVFVSWSSSSSSSTFPFFSPLLFFPFCSFSSSCHKVSHSLSLLQFREEGKAIGPGRLRSLGRRGGRRRRVGP